MPTYSLPIPAIRNCARCREDAICIALSDAEFFVRVRRMSYCYRYKYRPREKRICKTDTYVNPKRAITVWNTTFATRELAGETNPPASSEGEGAAHI